MSCPSARNRSSVGTVNGAVPMTTRRSGARVGASGAGAAGLGDLAQDHAALERRGAVDEQHAVQVVDLVLEAAGQQPVGRDLLLRPLEVPVAHPHRPRPYHVRVVAPPAEGAPPPPPPLPLPPSGG